MQAKKSLGQHFLKSDKAIRDIVAAGAIQQGETVLEIGPGRGVLTEALLRAGAHVIAIEKDRELLPVLKEHFGAAIAAGNLSLIEGDILTFDPSTIGTSYKLIANIPYYITGAIIEQFLSAAHQPQCIVLLIQKEVAERIVARDKKESVLSIAVKAYGTPQLIAKVPAGAFVPPPKVDSAILYIHDISRRFFDSIPERDFFSLLKYIFGRKRKQIAGSLAEYLKERGQAYTMLKRAHIDPKTRPEDLSLEKWRQLAQLLLEEK